MVLLGTSRGIHWKLGDNFGTSLGIVGTWCEHKELNPTTLASQKKKRQALRCMLNCLINYIKILFLKLFVPIFGLGWYKYNSSTLMLLVWFITNNCEVHPKWFFFGDGDLWLVNHEKQ